MDDSSKSKDFYLLSGGPRRFLDWKDFSFVPPDVMLYTKKYVKNFPRNDPTGMYLFGQSGGGKTTICSLVLRSLFEQNKIILRARMSDFPSLMQEMREGIANGSGDTDIITQYQRSDIVILDDMGLGKYSEYTLQQAYSIINYRYQNNLPTIYSSEFSPPKLSNIIGERLVSRIIETCQVIELNPGVNIRLYRVSNRDLRK